MKRIFASAFLMWWAVAALCQTVTPSPFDIMPVLGPRSWGDRAIKKYASQALFVVSPVVAQKNINMASNAGAGTNVAAANGDDVAGVPDLSIRGGAILKGSAALVFNTTALSFTTETGTVYKPGLTGGSSGGFAKTLQTGTGLMPAANAANGLTVFCVWNQAYDSSGTTRIVMATGIGANYFYLSKQSDTVVIHLNGNGYICNIPSDLQPLYVFAFTYDKTAGIVRGYFNGARVFEQTGVSPFTFSDNAIQVGGLSSAASNSNNGNLLWAAAYAGALPEADVRSEQTALCWEFGVRKDIILFEGNSYLVSPIGGAGGPSNTHPSISWPVRTMGLLGFGADIWVNKGNAGDKWSDLTNQYQTTVAPYASLSRTNCILIVCEVWNSAAYAIAQGYADPTGWVIAQAKAYCLRAKADGYTVLLMTGLPHSDDATYHATNVVVSGYNAALRKQYPSWGVKGLIDLQKLGITQYDGLHPGSAGHSKIAAEAAAVIQRNWRTKSL